MTKENFNLIKQMTKDYNPTGQPNPTKPKAKSGSLRDSMIQICYEIAHTEEQMQMLSKTNPQMYEYLKNRFKEIDPEREKFVYFPKKPKERGGKPNAR